MTGRTIRILAAVAGGATLTALTMGACGGGYSNPAGPSGAVVAAIITLTANGADRLQVRINRGERVRFVNNDSRNHDIQSFPHPAHNGCPPANVGVLTPGQSGETGPIMDAPGDDCVVHDNLNDADARFWVHLLLGAQAAPNPDY